MKICRLLFIAIICSASIQINAQNNDGRNVSEIDYAVKQINRICPTYMWDSWKFRDIMYEKELNTVYFVIQLKNWRGDKWNLTQEKMKEQTKWIIENFKKGYESTVSDKIIRRDGDFILYLSVGTLMHKLAATNTKLQIVLMKPDSENIIMKEQPLIISSTELNGLLK